MADTDEDDFGGFEAADPVVPDEGNNGQAEAGASPWAMLGAARGRPDLLCAQNAFPQYLDPSGISGGAANAGNPDNLPNGNAEAPLFDAHFDNGAGAPNDLVAGSRNARLAQARIAENVLDGTLNNNAAAAPMAANAVPPPSLPDLGIGPGNGAMARDNLPEPNVPEAELEEEERAPQGAHAPPEPEAAAVAPREADLALNNNALAAPEAARETSRLRQELEAAEARVRQLEEELAQTAREAETAKSRREELQARHSQELEEMQQSSQSCLRMVVDDYKAQSNAVVLEQREVSRQYLREELQEQARVFERLQQRLGEELEGRLTEAQRTYEEKLEQAVAEARTQQQEEFQKFLEEERQKNAEAIQKAVEEEREASRKKFLEAMQEEQERSAERIRLEQERLRSSFETVREECQQDIQKAVEEERKRLQEQLWVSVQEERERGQDSCKEILQQAKAETREYLEEHRQMDSRVRQRHLASLNLFLEGAQQQIRLLMESGTEKEPQNPAKDDEEDDGAKGGNS